MLTRASNNAAARRCLLILAASGFLAAHLGCGARPYRAAKLPDAMRAPSLAYKPKFDLASVRTSGEGSSRLAEGDLLRLTVLSGAEETPPEPTLARVAEDGTLDVPIVGPVPVAGLEPADAAAEIARVSVEKGIFVSPHVALELKSKAVNKITVLGAVNEPGVHEVPRNACDLISAIAAAGGLTDQASTEVEVLRHGAEPVAIPEPQAVVRASAVSPLPGNDGVRVARLDLAHSSREALSHQTLSDRDVVMVRPEEERLIHVSGVVEKPGQFELPSDQDVHLLDAIAMAGDADSPVANRVIVLRHMPGRPEPVVVRASIAKAKQDGRENIRLKAGDMVSVEQTPATAFVDTLQKLFRFSMGTSAVLF